MLLQKTLTLSYKQTKLFVPWSDMNKEGFLGGLIQHWGSGWI